MDEETRKEFNALLAEVAIEQGTLVRSQGDTYYGWRDWDDVRHQRTCGTRAYGRVYEDSWQEFQGTFYEGDETVYGVTVDGFYCNCGLLSDRSIRWVSSVQDAAEAVFEKLYRKGNK